MKASIKGNRLTISGETEHEAEWLEQWANRYFENYQPIAGAELEIIYRAPKAHCWTSYDSHGKRVCLDCGKVETTNFLEISK